MAADHGRRKGTMGFPPGGILVIVGVLAAIFGSWWLGIVIAIVGLVVFGGFATGKWF